jgi:hypothetical protein
VTGAFDDSLGYGMNDDFGHHPYVNSGHMYNNFGGSLHHQHQMQAHQQMDASSSNTYLTTTSTNSAAAGYKSSDLDTNNKRNGKDAATDQANGIKLEDGPKRPPPEREQTGL